MTKKRRITAKERDRRAAPAFIKQLRSIGVTLTRREDGTVEIFSATPIPPLLARFITDFSEEIGEVLAKECPASLPYSPDRACPDCQQPFVLIGFDASHQEQGEARLWRCGCHTLLGQEL